MTKSNNSVRAATPADLDVLAQLFDGYRRFYTQAADVAGARAFLQDRMQRGDSVLLLGLCGEQAGGFTQLYPSFSSVRMKRVWILNDLFVDPAMRGSGLGEALLGAAEAFAREDGAAYLSLQTDADNHTAQRLYERTGWQRDPSFHYERML